MLVLATALGPGLAHIRQMEHVHTISSTNSIISGLTPAAVSNIFILLALQWNHRICSLLKARLTIPGLIERNCCNTAPKSCLVHGGSSWSASEARTGTKALTFCCSAWVLASTFRLVGIDSLFRFLRACASSGVNTSGEIADEGAISAVSSALGTTASTEFGTAENSSGETTSILADPSRRSVPVGSLEAGTLGSLGWWPFRGLRPPASLVAAMAHWQSGPNVWLVWDRGLCLWQASQPHSIGSTSFHLHVLSLVCLLSSLRACPRQPGQSYVGKYCFFVWELIINSAIPTASLLHNWMGHTCASEFTLPWDSCCLLQWRPARCCVIVGWDDHISVGLRRGKYGGHFSFKPSWHWSNWHLYDTSTSACHSGSWNMSLPLGCSTT